MVIHFCILQEHYACMHPMLTPVYIFIQVMHTISINNSTHTAYIYTHLHTRTSHNCTFEHTVCRVSLSMYMYCLLQSVAMCIQYRSNMSNFTRNMSCLLQLIRSFCILHSILVKIPLDNDWRLTGPQSCDHHFLGSSTHSDPHVQMT